MIDWNDCTPLTRDELDDFINAAIPHIANLESKNKWDFFVNDMSISSFCERLFIEAFEINDYEDYQRNYRKVEDIYAIRNILAEEDWEQENKYFRNHKDSEIWKLVLNKVNSIADAIF